MDRSDAKRRLHACYTTRLYRSFSKITFGLSTHNVPSPGDHYAAHSFLGVRLVESRAAAI